MKIPPVLLQNWNKLRLSTRLSMALLAGISSLALIVGSYIVSTSYKQEVARFEERFKSSFKLASSSLAHSLWSYNQPAAESIAQALLQDHQLNIHQISIRLNDQTSFFDFQKEVLPTSPSDLVTLSEKIYYEENFVGELSITSSKDEMFKNAIHQIFILIFLVVMTVFAGSFIIWSIVEEFLNAPLHRLVMAFRSMDKNPSSLQDSAAPEEFSEIIHTYNQALLNLKKRDQQIQEYTLNLESLVQQRTQELDHQRLMAVENSRLAALGRVAAGIAHEINNPLAIISGKASILRKQLGDRPDLLNHVDRIHAMVHRVSTITKSLLALGRNGSFEEPTNFEVEDLVQEVLDLFQLKIQKTRVKVQLEIESCQIQARRTLISQVLLNLCSNAADAIQGQDQAQITIQIQCLEKQAVFRVIDSGTGIPEDVKEKIFDPFFTTKDVGQGTGLGLSLCRRFLKDHGSDLSYELYNGHTSFTFRLPMAEASQRSTQSTPPLDL